MGRRARAKGISNKAVRVARAAFEERDEECAAIAQRVYHVAHELKTDDAPEPLPLSVLAPVLMAAEEAAPGACKLAGLPVTEENARRVAAYLVAGFREMAVQLDPAHLRHWEELAERVARGEELPGEGDATEPAGTG